MADIPDFPWKQSKPPFLTRLVAIAYNQISTPKKAANNLLTVTSQGVSAAQSFTHSMTVNQVITAAAIGSSIALSATGIGLIVVAGVIVLIDCGKAGVSYFSTTNHISNLKAIEEYNEESIDDIRAASRDLLRTKVDEAIADYNKTKTSPIFMSQSSSTREAITYLEERRGWLSNGDNLKNAVEFFLGKRPSLVDPERIGMLQKLKARWSTNTSKFNKHLLDAYDSWFNSPEACKERRFSCESRDTANNTYSANNRFTVSLAGRTISHHELITKSVLPYLISKKEWKQKKMAIKTVPIIGSSAVGTYGKLNFAYKKAVGTQGKNRENAAYWLAYHYYTHKCNAASAIIIELLWGKEDGDYDLIQALKNPHTTDVNSIEFEDLVAKLSEKMKSV